MLSMKNHVKMPKTNYLKLSVQVTNIFTLFHKLFWLAADII